MTPVRVSHFSPFVSHNPPLWSIHSGEKWDTPRPDGSQ